MPFDPLASAKYGGNQVETRRRYTPDPLIDWADRVVPVVVVLNKLGLHVPDGADNWRTTCPFAYEHPNKDKGFRVHATNNNCYCYGWHGFLTPTKLVAHSQSISRLDAAKQLLDERGLRKYTSYQDRWENLQTKSSATHGLSDTQDLLSQLQVDASNIVGYTDVEFDKAVRDTWVRIMAALEGLSQTAKTQQITVKHLDRWYTWSLELLVHAVKEESNGKVTESEA